MIIFHENCSDGLCAAAITSYITGDSICIPSPAGKTHELKLPASQFPSEAIYLVDLSATEETVAKWESLGYKVTMFDHHEIGPGIRFKETDIHDKTRSGAMIMYDFWANHRPIRIKDLNRYLVEYVQDRDLWQWKLPNSKEVSAYLSTVEPTVPAWIEVLIKISIIDAAHLGGILLKKQDQIVKQHVKKARFGSHSQTGDYAQVFATVHQSEIGNMILMNNPNVKVVFIYNGETCSLRANNQFNCAEFCQQRGGGGHKNAAGFPCSMVFPEFEI